MFIRSGAIIMLSRPKKFKLHNVKIKIYTCRHFIRVYNDRWARVLSRSSNALYVYGTCTITIFFSLLVRKLILIKHFIRRLSEEFNAVIILARTRFSREPLVEKTQNKQNVTSKLSHIIVIVYTYENAQMNRLRSTPLFENNARSL